MSEAGGESAPAISFHDVGKRFGDDWVLRNIELRVDPGTIVGLIGPSGCGKTTSVRLATGFYRPDEGELEVLGSAPSMLSTGDRTELGYLPQHPVLFDDLSLRDNLHFHSSLNGVPFRRKRRLDELLDLVELSDDDHKLVSESSGGMQRRLALAATLVHRPKILMLDEPTAGIDPILRRRFWEHFRSLRDDGVTLVISTQFVGEAADCDVVAMLAAGRVAAIGTPDELFLRAHGGQPFDVSFTDDVRAEAIRELRDHDAVVSAERIGDRVVRITTNVDAEELQRVCSAVLPSCEVASTAAVPPDWDEVFIALVDAPDREQTIDADGSAAELAHESANETGEGER
ncbi:ABC transporter ATP-binding protein [Ilumatobacter nonamiensis]|uniref:ABC transporter ATP-binding protein n=1 Tax=Ilumatobacter nonamiensis TaxID=467093 RepID=UPI00034CC2F0|nr:ABC transporter ATP-binding protein [Ilumatobacter nonamiensis]